MDFGIRFDYDVRDLPLGGIMLTQDGNVYQRIASGNYRGLFRDLRRDDAHGIDFSRYTRKVHRIMTRLDGRELAFLVGWYAGRYFEAQAREKSDCGLRTCDCEPENNSALGC